MSKRLREPRLDKVPYLTEAERRGQLYRCRTLSCHMWLQPVSQARCQGCMGHNDPIRNAEPAAQELSIAERIALGR